MKSIKGHSGFFGCGKCVQEGCYLKNRICFPELDSALRTDQSFKNKDQIEHHLSDSILTNELDVKMITQFPLDYLHLVCLGVVRKLLDLWTSSGPFSVRLSKIQIKKINSLMSFAEENRPREIQRTIRKINHYKLWKGKECRTFLLYTGPVALKYNVKKFVYDNFMLLSVAIRILCDENLVETHRELANKLLIAFVKSFKKIYGACFVSYNIHNLIHTANDTQQFGKTDNFSAFPVESFMYQIKRLIRKGNRQLQQVTNRLMEKMLNESQVTQTSDSKTLLTLSKQKKCSDHVTKFL